MVESGTCTVSVYDVNSGVILYRIPASSRSRPAQLERGKQQKGRKKDRKLEDIPDTNPQLKLPLYITNNTINNTLVIVDNKACALLLYDQMGQFMHQYQGNENDTKEIPPCMLSHPCGVCVDLDGNVIVADRGKNCVNIFTPELRFMRTLLTDPDVTEPRVVKVDGIGRLIVGESTGKVKVFLYQQQL